MIKKILIGIGVLLIAVLVGAGWYFSGLIYEIGFNVNNRDNLNAGTSEDIIFVEEIKEDSVVLNVQNERWGPLLENGIYGVIGDNGFIIVNDIISSNDGIVERKIEYKEGSIENGEGVSYSLSLYERADGNFVPVGITRPLDKSVKVYLRQCLYPKWNMMKYFTIQISVLTQHI